MNLLERRHKVLGLLFWPGALFFVFYNYLVYLLSMPLNLAFLLHLLLVALSAYTMIALVVSIDAKAVRDRLAGRVFERFGGGVLAGLGLLFLVRVLVVLITGIVDGTPIPHTEVALSATDLLISPAVIIGGLLLWRRRPLGYVAGLGLLFQLSMLFVGLIAVLVLQPLMIEVEFILGDLLAVLIMGLVAFVPFGLYVRGTVTS